MTGISPRLFHAIVSEADPARESRLRSKARRQGLALQKSRTRVDFHARDWGGYRIIDLDRNAIVAGGGFDLSLNDVEAVLAGEEE